ncbi:hypothetical protein AB4Y96_09305 [Phyllobacterium sp. TAF24]|uniref:hypothetical protein n=1 Tax=Phyllobacterium sp. TAF24 TaxID=3233068 RepID=UPI003F9A6919
MKYTMLNLFAAQIYWGFLALAAVMCAAVTWSYFTEGSDVYNNTPMLIGLYFAASLICLLGFALRWAIRWLAKFI